MPSMNRRQFLGRSLAAAALPAVGSSTLLAQSAGHRPEQAPGLTVLNPRDRVPVGIIIDDSTCLVNLNRFAMPQFDEAWEGQNASYHRDWKSWPRCGPNSAWASLPKS